MICYSNKQKLNYKLFLPYLAFLSGHFVNSTLIPRKKDPAYRRPLNISRWGIIDRVQKKNKKKGKVQE